MKYGSSSTLQHSIGTISVEIGVDGDVDRGDELCNYMLVAATTISNFEALRMAADGRNGGDLHQQFEDRWSFGSVSASVKIVFDLNHQVPNRTLNSLICIEIMPEIWRAIGTFLGTQKAPRPRSHKVVLDRIDHTLDALGLDTEAGARTGSTNGRQGGRSTSSRRPAAARR